MKRLLALLFTVVLIGLGATPAWAESQEEISRLDVTLQLQADGSGKVIWDMDYDFGTRSRHGPVLVFLEKTPLDDDPDHYWQTKYKMRKSTSDSGAPAKINKEYEGQTVVYKIGSKNKTVTGKHHYRFEIDVTGLVNPRNEESGLDELNWNVIGTGWMVPIKNITVKVSGPGTPERVMCEMGGKVDCALAKKTADGGDFATKQASPGQYMQVVVGYPVNTFPGLEKSLTRRSNVRNSFPLDPLQLGISGVLTVLGGALVSLFVARKGRDDAYLGLTPGLKPTENAVIGKAKKVPVAVQFTPPKHARAAQLGILIDEKADDRDIAAILIELAVKDVIDIEPIGPGEWRFTLLKPANSPELLWYEQQFLTALFGYSTVRTTSQLRSSEYHDFYSDTRRNLTKSIASKQANPSWFKSDPAFTRAGWRFGGAFLTIVGAVLFVVLGMTFGWPWIALPLIVVGIILFLTAGSMPARTADGSAALAQTKGFELYLRTAEADQLRWEEGEDIFAKYLPYAVAFGVADRWAKLFATLAASGAYVTTTPWLVRHGYDRGGLHNMGYFVSDMSTSVGSSIAEAVSSHMQETSSSSLGGSGFSGGGGFGGSGGGSW